MSYTRVIPRDFFNESKLLKCFGQLSLKVLDDMLPENIKIHIEENGEAFQIEMDEVSEGLVITNIKTTVNDEQVLFYTIYNSKDSYPFYCLHGSELIQVFNEHGEFAEEFISYFQNINHLTTKTNVMNKIAITRSEDQQTLLLTSSEPVTMEDLLNACEDSDMSVDWHVTGHLMLLDDRYGKAYMVNDHYLDVIEVLNETGALTCPLSILEYELFQR